MDPPGDRLGTNIPPGRNVVLLIAHGSREPAANDDLHALADRLAASGEYPIVVASFLERTGPISRPVASVAPPG